MLLLFPCMQQQASGEDGLSDSLQVLRLLEQARKPSITSLSGFRHDSALSAQALELAERIGWQRGVFKGHLWSMLSISGRSYEVPVVEWEKHLQGALQLRAWASPQEVVLLYRVVGRNHVVHGEMGPAAAYLDTAQWEAQRCGDTLSLALVAYWRAYMLRVQERWGEAFRAILTSNARSSGLNNPVLKSASFNLSGMIRGRLGDLDGAVKDFTTSLAIADSIKVNDLRIVNHTNWAYVMQVKGHWRDALDQYREVRGILISTSASRDEISECETGIGYMLVRLDSLEQAEAILGRLHSTKAMVGHPYEQEFNNAWALLQLRRGRYHDAVASAYTAFVTEQSDENDVIKRDASHILAEAFKALKQPNEALKWTEITHQWADSVLYRQQAAASVKAAFDQELQLGREQAVREREQAQVAMERVRTQRVILLVISVLILVIAALLLNRYRLKRRLQVEQLRARLSRDLHDDIGSTLSSISILSNVARKRAEATGDAEATASLDKISDRSQRLMRNMSDIVWSVDPQKDSLEELIMRMRGFATGVLEAKGIAFTFDLPAEVPLVALAAETKNNLYLIFKEAINNVVKHAEAKKVDVCISLENGLLRFEVKDDGRGMDPSAPTNGPGGNGLRNMRERAKEMKADFSLETASDRGSTVSLSVLVE